ncbi:MAG: hypothetical protein E7500_00605 [Ruminococcus sp.]|nr:hypothetical protein [Ruminococcus sp.]
MNNLQEKKRYYAVDFCCILGVILMIGLDFFRKSGFEQTALTGVISVLPLALRWLCMAGVPLIILVNGASFSRDTFSFSQYKGFFKLIYCTAVCFAVMWIYTGGHPDSFPTSSVKPFYYYDGIDFALMYSVLLLLSPFLNCTYQALPNNRAKAFLVGSFAFLSSMPNILIFGGNYILPVELTQLWPVTLYFLGAFIWENRRKFDFLGGAVFTICLCFSQAILSYADSLNSELLNFDSKRLNQYSSINVVATAGAIFMALCGLRTKSRAVRKTSKALAGFALPIILICHILEDNLIRIFIGEKELTDLELMKYFIPFVITAVGVSYLVSAILIMPFGMVKSLFGIKKRAVTADESEYSEQEQTYEEIEADDDDEDNGYVGRYELGNDEKDDNNNEAELSYRASAEASFADIPVRRSPDEISVDELLALITNK